MATPTEIVTNFCDAFARRDPDELAGYFTEDAVYHNIPLEPVQGRAAIRDTIAGFSGMAEKIWFDTLRILADGPIVMNRNFFDD